MEQPIDHHYGTYRCPVCGHRDMAGISSGHDAARVVCTYCETDLEVRSRGRESVRLAVRVAGEAATH